MESKGKKLRFASKEELDRLADNEQWPKLHKRLKKRTYTNLIYDIKQRQPPFPHRDVFQCIMIHIDIRSLLDWSISIPEVAILLAEDLFWKKKLESDFPEVHCKGFDPCSIQGTDDFVNQPWRRFYYVIRYLMHRIVYRMLTSISIAYTDDTQYSFSFAYSYDYPHIQRFVNDEKRNVKYGKSKIITIAALLDLFDENWDPSNYLPRLKEDFTKTPNYYKHWVRSFIEEPTLHFLTDITSNLDTQPLHDDTRLTFRQLIARGYAKYDEKKKIVIG